MGLLSLAMAFIGLGGDQGRVPVHMRRALCLQGKNYYYYKAWPAGVHARARARPRQSQPTPLPVPFNGMAHRSAP